MHCWARYLFIAVVVTLGTLSMMSACGRKGPLYLPEDSPSEHPASGKSDVPAPPAGETRAPRPDQH